ACRPAAPTPIRPAPGSTSSTQGASGCTASALSKAQTTSARSGFRRKRARSRRVTFTSKSTTARPTPSTSPTWRTRPCDLRTRAANSSAECVRGGSWYNRFYSTSFVSKRLALLQDIQRGDGQGFGGGGDHGLGFGGPERAVQRRELRRVAAGRVPFRLGRAADPEDQALDLLVGQP